MPLDCKNLTASGSYIPNPPETFKTISHNMSIAMHCIMWLFEVTETFLLTHAVARQNKSILLYGSASKLQYFSIYS